MVPDSALADAMIDVAKQSVFEPFHDESGFSDRERRVRYNPLSRKERSSPLLAFFGLLRWCLAFGSVPAAG